ncbi:hypothetical protein BKA82DRAFT_437870 [Pisolithus tinctorius]|uniref:Uncharacterized protein n=1 Tax=Pisolithus tinctorius Marx 270 TaxID=870435 RepID=A0A0C3P0N5_PISTI|nr:hypothetical protein BKA82DRAFT_437870 [Pisolithus tinctorius]KIO06665.1 hypothetical protein M404DRAFT_437870 [Pisolithus tinctorius Marx 270]
MGRYFSPVVPGGDTVRLSPRHSIAFIDAGGEVHTGNVVATALLPHIGTCEVGGEIVLTAENSSSYNIEVDGVEKISNTIDPGHTTSQTQFQQLAEGSDPTDDLI